VQINPRTTAKDLVKILEETGTKVSISTVKRVRYPKPQQKKSDYGYQLHMGTKIVPFGEVSSGLMKQKYNYLSILTIIMFGGKRGRLASQRAQGWQHHGVGFFAAGGTGALHKIDSIMR
jgi:hypothetical protein